MKEEQHERIERQIMDHYENTDWQSDPKCRITPRQPAVLCLLAAGLAVWAFPPFLSELGHVNAQPVEGAARTEQVANTAVCCLSFSPDSQTMAGASQDGRLIIWSTDSRSGREKTAFTTKQSRVTAIAFHPNGESLFLAGREVERWSAKTWQRTETIDLDGSAPFRISAFSLDCTKVAGTHERALRVWDAQTGRVARDFALMGVGLKAAFSPDGRLVAVGTLVNWGDTEGQKSGLQIWDLSSGKLKHAILVPTGSISGLAFSHDAKTIAGGTHRELFAWDTESANLKQRFGGFSGPIEAVAFSPDDQLLAAGGQGPELRLPSPAGTVLLSEMKLWTVKTAELVQSSVNELGRTTSVAFSPDGKHLAWCDYRSVTMEDLTQPGVGWTKNYGL